MKRLIPLLLFLPSMPAMAHGPALGVATDVTITSVGVDDATSGESCKDFKLSPAQAQAFLNRADIVTQREIHDYYDIAPCYVRGKARFHGYPATWEIRAAGTGFISLMGGEYLPIVDVKERNIPK